MLKKKKLAVSASSSILQVAISGLTVFFLYRYLLDTIGADRLGIWALVLAASGTVQAANLGMSGSIIKHIADYEAQKNPEKIGLAVQTAALSIGAFGLLFALALLPTADYYFRFSLSKNDYHDAMSILPQALMAFWVYMVTGIYQSALYGCQQIAQRNLVLVIDSLSYLIMCILLAPSYGLPGLAWARLAQNLITYAVSALLMKRRVRCVPVLPHSWNKDLFKEMFSYAVNFQIISILVMLLDPVTKGFLSRYGSVATVAYYEMASKLTQLFRALLVNANQVLVPSYAHYKTLDEGNISDVYKLSYRVIFYFAVPGFCFMAVATPLISELWIGQLEPIFIASMLMLSLGWLVNTLGVPAYHAGMGTGHMKDNLFAHILMTFANIVLIFLIGESWQGLGVILAWALSLSLGGAFLIYTHHIRNALSISMLLPHPSRVLALFCLIGTAVSYLVWAMLRDLGATIHKGGNAYLGSQGESSVFVTLIFIFLVALPMWRHPIRRQLTSLLSKHG